MPQESPRSFTHPRHAASFLAQGIAVIALLAATAAHAQQPAFTNTLLPLPSQLQLATGGLPITSTFTVSSSAAQNPILQAATRRMLDRIEQQTNTPLSKTLLSSNGTLAITVADIAGQRPTLETDESYTLRITATGIVLQAPTVFGAMHGLETIQQLVQPRNNAFILPALTIDDTPRFPWRGLMIDVGRHFMPLPVLYRTIDAMATVKMNVLHLHLTDDQGFRIESRRFPKLTQMGSDGLFYTQQQMRDLIAYASAHGIRIVPEFDVPGHVTSWLVGYPEIGSNPRTYQISRTFGVWDGALDPTRESTYKFLDAFIDEMAALFPDEYMHMGGDESNGKDWKSNPAITAYMQQHNIKSTDDLQVYFSTRVLALVKKHHKQMVGWDEILQPTTPKDAIIHSWRGAESLTTAAKQGNRSILSAPYYLDAMKTSEKMYLDDPLPASGTLTPEQQKLVLGGEATMWAEQVTSQTIDSRIWPRTAALAERFWSPQTIRDIDDLYRRLDIESLRLEAAGLTHISGPNAGLRQLTGSEEAAAQLAVLTSTLTPTPFHYRYEQQKTSQLTPMGNVVDFTRPDPATRQDLHLLVDRYLHTMPSVPSAMPDPAHELARQQLESLFHSWIATRPALDAIAIDHPLLNGVALRRQQLPQLGLLGIEALGYLESHTAPTAEWTQSQITLLKQAAEPHDIVDFVVLPPLHSLLEKIDTNK